MTGHYAAPHHDEADATLEGGYVPPSGSTANTITVTLHPDGIYAYRAPPCYVANASLAAGYTAPSGIDANQISVTLAKPLADASTLSVYPEGMPAPDVGLPTIFSSLQTFAVRGFDAIGYGTPSIRLRQRALAVSNDPQNRSIVTIPSGYTLPRAQALLATLARYGSFGRVGFLGIRNVNQTITPHGIGAGNVMQPAVYEGQRWIYPAGWNALRVSSPVVTDTAVKPAGIAPPTPVFGTAAIYNRRQYVTSSGFVALRTSEPYVQGGVKTVVHTGYSAMVFGLVEVINTTANQQVRPRSIEAPEMARPEVSPRSLRPSGIYAAGVGFPVVQFPPNPKGWLSQAFGYPVVDFKTKKLNVSGFDALEVGYPRVRDRAQKVWPPSAPVTDLFGDVAVRLRTLKIFVPGLYAHESNPWVELRNTRRILEVPGLNATAMGAASVRNKSPNLTPHGFDGLKFGSADVAGPIKYISPKGISNQVDAIPPPVLSKTPNFTPNGIAAPAVSGPTIWMRLRAFDIGGFSALRMGAPVVDFGWRKLVLQDEGIAGSLYGEARVEHTYRSVAPQGWEHLAFGRGWISFGRRYLEPVGIEAVEMSRHAIGGTRWVGPEGFEATRWLTRIVPEAREIYPKTFGAEYGWPTVQNKSQSLLADGFTTETDWRARWGLAKVWNLRQHITQEENAESLLWPPGFAPWLKVENRNKTIGAIGYAATLYGRPQADNHARLLKPSGIAAPMLPEYQKTGAVTHRVRPLPMDGIEPPFMTGWAVVWNKGVPMYSVGFEAELFGKAQVINTRRHLSMQGFGSMEIGRPFVAFAIRGLTFESRYGIAPPVIQLPKVQLATRYVDVPGIDGAVRGQIKLGLPIVVSRFNRIVTRWAYQERTGEPIVRNLKPALKVRNWIDSEFGTADVRLQWRPVAPDGSNMTLFGKTLIADRRQRVVVTGFNNMRFGDKLTVRRYGLDPVVTQYVDLRRFKIDEQNVPHEEDNGFGIEPIKPQVGAADLTKGYVYHLSRDAHGDMLVVGRPIVHANSIRVEPGYWDLLVGEPTVSLKHRVLEVSGIGPLVEDSADVGSMGSWGLPRLSPHTIYAVMEATPQAKRNHGRSELPISPVNSVAVFGTPRVALATDNVLHHKDAYFGGRDVFMGRATVFNSVQNIKVNGWHSLRLGMVDIPGTRTIEDEDGLDSLVFGSPAVTRPPYVGPLFIQGEGLASSEVGEHGISHYHRNVTPPGWFSEEMGDSRDHFPLNMPVSLCVGPPNLHDQEGFDASAFGDAWISHSIRELKVPGWDSFLCDYDYQNFNLRMRVRRTGESSPQWQVVGARGFVDTAMGTPNVRPGVHYIRPDGNSDQFRKGVPTS